MHDLGLSKARSISRTLSVGLIITLVLVAALSLGVNFILSSREAKAELETKVEEYISALTDALKVPLWSYSEETIEAICTSYAQNEFVAKLLVEDQKGAVIFKKQKADQRLVASKSKDVFYSTLSIFSALMLRSILYIVRIRLCPLGNRSSSAHEMTSLIF